VGVDLYRLTAKVAAIAVAALVVWLVLLLLLWACVAVLRAIL